MFPAPVITFIVTFILKSAFQWLMESSKNKAEIAKAKERRKGQENRHEVEDVEHVRSKIHKTMFSWTGTILAVSAFVFIIGIPKISPFIAQFQEPSVIILNGQEVLVKVHPTESTYVYTEERRGFIFQGRIEETDTISTTGITIMPFETHLISAIAACFFGWRRRN